jgi:hypothetical protein
MRWHTLRRWFRNGFLTVALLSLAVYLTRDFVFFTFLYRGTRADWELSQIPNECYEAHDQFTDEVRRSGASPKDIERARERFAAKEAKIRDRCLTLARENPGTQAELTALFLIAGKWPKTQKGANARERLLKLADTADMKYWGDMFQTTSEPHDRILHPLAADLVRRVKETPELEG